MRARPDREPDPEAIIQAVLRRAEVPHSTLLAKQILTDLAGSRIVLTYQPPSARPCPEHPSIIPPCPLHAGV